MESTHWLHSAACTGVDVELFFSDLKADEAEAKRYCARCSVRAQCLDLGVTEAWGIFGGMTVNERIDRFPVARAVYTAMRRGRRDRADRASGLRAQMGVS